MTVLVSTTRARRQFLVNGIVQGVGFRPFVYVQAQRLGLSGFVCNDSEGVTIEVEGDCRALAAFEHALREHAPPLARVDSIVAQPLPTRGDECFVIAASTSQPTRHALIASDVAPCADCLRELWSLADRRFQYPFINCTNCGPRFTIVMDVPYDRRHTTMHAFVMCPACQREYDDPRDRRFHAQPNACPVCGPQLHFSWLRADATMDEPFGDNPIGAAAAVLHSGQIVAVNGLGGYHLACDAANTIAVAHLRQRKRRDAKPFALMVPDLATARAFCVMTIHC